MCAIYADASPTYQPAMRVISAITQASPMVVTTSFDHDYISGTIVRLTIPIGFGMEEANDLVGEITVTGTDTFTLPFDAQKFNIFASPVAFPDTYQRAQVLPIGERNDMLDAAVQNVL